MKLIFLVFIPVLSIFSCGDSVTYNASHSADAKPKKPRDVSVSCDSNDEAIFEQVLLFTSESSPGCLWIEKDNLSKRDGFFRAYGRQDIDIALPEAAEICQVSLDIESKSMKFDDEVFLLIDEAVILSSHNYNDLFKTDPRNLSIFDWQDIKGRSYKRTKILNDSYCLGEKQGLSECKVPVTEETEEMKFSINSEVLSGLEILKDGKSSTISWVVTGDNDASDCRHKNFHVKFKMSYVE